MEDGSHDGHDYGTEEHPKEHCKYELVHDSLYSGEFERRVLLVEGQFGIFAAVDHTTHNPIGVS